MLFELTKQELDEENLINIRIKNTANVNPLNPQENTHSAITIALLRLHIR